MKTTGLLLSSIALASFTGCAAEIDDLGETSSGIAGTSFVTPTAHAGNFVASDDDQVCYELAERFGWDITSEMRGFKIDPPTSVGNAAGDFILDQPYLHWTAGDGASVLAVIVKGGPNFNLYDYQPYPNLGGDSWLRSPTHKGKVPAISHYNVCYQVTEPGAEGCTPGYWRNHTDRWADYVVSASFDDTFGVTSGLGATYTLGQAIWAQGGGLNALARHATAALLNAAGGVANADGTTVAYPMTVDEVIAAVQAALAEGGNVEATKDRFAGYNELGCPLDGTSATR